jgi:low affinity Fe/Cu permease
MREFFRRCAHRASAATGSAWTFLAAVALVLTWALTGALFHYSDSWQLVINTGTSVVTFLVVFLIQSSQNRDTRAIHLKLDELLRSILAARNELVDLESLSDEEIERLRREFRGLAQQERHEREQLPGRGPARERGGRAEDRRRE